MRNGFKFSLVFLFLLSLVVFSGCGEKVSNVKFDIGENSVDKDSAINVDANVNGVEVDNNKIEQKGDIDNVKIEEKYIVDSSDFVDAKTLIVDIKEAKLSDEEIKGLIQMREEEKLARDVYKVLGDKWGINVFSNIAKSEQTHTDAIKVLLDRYGIEDPVKSDEVGFFTSSDLNALYVDLIHEGDKSLLDALMVGATIEDLDIADLNEFMTGTSNDDILIVYSNLARGSRNHLRAYVRQTELNGGVYTPKYILKLEFDDIIEGKQETGNVNGMGNERGNGKGYKRS